PPPPSAVTPTRAAETEAEEEAEAEAEAEPPAAVPASLAPQNGDGPPQDEDEAPQALFRQPEEEPDDAAFGEVPQLFQNPEDLAAATDDGDETGPLSSAAAVVPPGTPTGRALADLYYSQGHYAEALQIYDDLVTRHPYDEELMKMRREAE